MYAVGSLCTGVHMCEYVYSGLAHVWICIQWAHVWICIPGSQMPTHLYIYTSIYLCIYTYLHIYISIYLHVYTSIDISIYRCIYLLIYISIYLHIYIDTSIYTSIHRSIYLLIYISIYLHIYIDTSIYTSIHPSNNAHVQAKHTLERKEMYEEQRDEALADLKKAEARCVPHIPKYALMLADL